MERTSLTETARVHLAAAHEHRGRGAGASAGHASTSGRSAHTVYGGHDRVLRQTVIALVAGQSLHEHENPGEATLQVLQGRVTLSAGESDCEGVQGDLIVIPARRHAVHAVEDSVVLLTVAKLDRRPGVD